jgi:hypothetical protein
MKKLLALIVLAAIGFYAAWPIYSGWRLMNAMNNGDAAGLANLVDFDSVRRSMRPAVEAQVGQRVDQQMAQMNPLVGKMAGDFKGQITSQVADTVLSQVVTPENVIRIAREGGNVAGTVEKIVMEQMSKAGGLPGLPGGGSGGGGMPAIPGGLGGVLGGLGGLGGAAGQLGIPGMGGGAKVDSAPAPAIAPPSTANSPTPKPSYGLGNIKSFGFAGPLGLSLSVARDPAATKPDLTTVMRFTGSDWKITDVVPHL